MQIAIDGPAGSGKSTIAKIVAKKLKLLYLDTGAMYRCIAYGAHDAGIGMDEDTKIIDFARECTIEFYGQDVLLNGKKVTTAIRTSAVGKMTSAVAAIAGVRHILVKKQQAIAADEDVIMDGRDIGSVVLPQANYKFYLDARVNERAKRRYKDLVDKGIKESIENIEQDIIERDRQDKNRDEGPLVKTHDAIYIDTTGKSIDEVVNILLERIQKAE